MKKLMVVAAVGLALLSSAPAATGQEVDAITVEVPVQLENLLPEVDRVRVYCTVFPSASQSDGSDLIGSGNSALLALSADGSYSGTTPVRIRADAADLHKFSSAKYYRCVLNLALSSGGWGRPGLERPDAWLQPKPGTNLVTLVAGTIP